MTFDDSLSVETMLSLRGLSPVNVVSLNISNQSFRFPSRACSGRVATSLAVGSKPFVAKLLFALVLLEIFFVQNTASKSET